MRVWTVHTPPEASRLRRARRIEGRLPALVPEGFAWLAFLFGLPWLLWHRLWLEAVIYVGLLAILAALLPVKLLPVAALAVQWLLGAEAQDLRRAALARRGFRQAHVVAEQDADRALARVLAMQPELVPTTRARPA
ncbi:MAG: DUF2628 domain-containing protein [Acetobacteraceae bacterium]|nr:MAG: DUF2628 domain-containing protein [Acetobacteraceae bacterium]